jgi:exonuclease VII large subunit
MRFDQVQTRLRLLSPGTILERGYSITFEAASGRVVRDPAALKPGASIRSKVASGEILSTVSEVRSLGPRGSS